MKRLLLIAPFLLIAFIGCSQEPKATTSPRLPPVPEKFDDLRVYEVFPTIDGGAYVVARGRLYYVIGAQIIRVQEVDKIAYQQAQFPATSREQLWFNMYSQQLAKARYGAHEIEAPESVRP
jgi:hypothetical protein